MKENPQDVRLVYRHFPLNSHDKSLLTAQAAEAAALQGKFWEMHDAIFAGQSTWGPMTVEQATVWLTDTAKSLGLDATKFSADLTSDAIVQQVKADQDKGTSIGLPGTPFMLINGRIYQGPSDYANLTAVAKLIMLEDRQFTTCPPMTIDKSKQYIATIKTDVGDIVIRLYADKAPTTVNSFVFLARNGWFDGSIFHRVIPNFVAQAGDPTGTGYAGPGYAFGDEIQADLRFDRPGLVAMANAGSGTNGSQFFITFAPLPNLDGKYTIFGEVISGMDVTAKLTPRNPADTSTPLPEGSKIISVTIQEK